MKVKEFVGKNADILISELTPAAFDDLTCGQVVFVINTSNGTKPIMDRPVLSCGYHMVVATNRDQTGKLLNAQTLALTKAGYAKIDFLNAGDIDGQGHKLIMSCKPLPKFDEAKRNYRWTH